MRCAGRLVRRLGLALALSGTHQGWAQGAGLQVLSQMLPDRPQLWGTLLDGLNFVQGWAGRGLPEWVAPSRILSYTARKPRYDALGQPLLDAQGELLCDQVHLSGRVFFPPAWRARSLEPLPVVVFTHGTCMRKDAVPSTFGGHEWMFGAAAAIYYGLVVVMPDLPGMGGDSSSYHPFCHRRSLAYAVVDALPAVRSLLETDAYLRENQYRLDPRLFLMGYSEGGYASLAAARELESQARPEGDGNGFILSGTVCMGAPCDLSGATRAAFLATDVLAPHCFYLPFIVLGYQAVYGRIIDPMEIFAPCLLESREDGNVLQWAAGGIDAFHVDAALARRLGAAAGRVVLRQLFNPAWVSEVLESPQFSATPLGRILEENDLAKGWAPTCPILFAHSADDRDIPIQNAFHGLETLSEAIRREGRDPSTLMALSMLGAPGEGVGHVAAVFPGYAKAFRWIEAKRRDPAKRTGPKAP